MVVAHSLRKHFWFGTEESMRWFPTPNRGADMSSEGWADGGSLLNGGGHQQNSFGSHGNYIFEWPSSSAMQVAQTMKSYRDGTYGRGLIYFIDPLTFGTNILPPYWADPSLGVGDTGMSLVYGVEPTALPTSNRAVNDLPVTSALYNLAGVPAGWRGKEDAVFIPIPEGYTLLLGAIYAYTGTARVFYRPQLASGGLGTTVTVTAKSTGVSNLADVAINSGSAAGIWLYVGRSSTAASTLTLIAMVARLVRTDKSPATSELREGPWIGGQGHSGCRFVGVPTRVNNSGVDGGQVSFAASFREVGHWVHG